MEPLAGPNNALQNRYLLSLVRVCGWFATRANGREVRLGALW